ncbi:MAG: hypothetical protein A2X12_02920 [Bacteroidetes bacterium GWE2_29_8]|nr:MAG: hypothetical protein A2X12_02920 [Bacteroidetes bacterium GWE2_29_8]OFY24498.1 MAG: hypothetical protein A2X02_01780 [Bacteroidetes bacterium GWF2_29_10]
MHKINVSTINYLNSTPFNYGLNNSAIIEKIALQENTPNDCANLLKEEKVNIGLAPIAIIPHLKKAFIISDYCIGCYGAVKSVCIYSNVKIQYVKKIYTDNHSITSVFLAKILSAFYWQIKPEWINIELNNLKEIKSKHETILAIGDKTFYYEKEYLYCYDLGEVWLDFTSLPFVFACWISNTELDESFIQEFNTSLLYGLKRKPESLEHKDIKSLKIDKQTALNYITNNISYEFNSDKQKALKTYFDYLYKYQHR